MEIGDGAVAWPLVLKTAEWPQLSSRGGYASFIEARRACPGDWSRDAHVAHANSPPKCSREEASPIIVFCIARLPDGAKLVKIPRIPQEIFLH